MKVFTLPLSPVIQGDQSGSAPHFQSGWLTAKMGQTHGWDRKAGQHTIKILDRPAVDRIWQRSPPMLYFPTHRHALPE